MKFLKFSKLFGAGWNRKNGTKAGAKSHTRPRIRLQIEELEDRLAPSVTPVLPAVTTLSQPTIGSGFDPQIVIDPSNPQKMVEVHSTGSGLAGNYSTDGGATWNAFLFSNNVGDPNQYLTPAFAAVSSPSISFDTLGNFYVVDTQHDATNTSGAVVIEKFNFSSGGVSNVNGTQSVLYRWYKQDAAANPVVGVDTNPTSYTDPQTGATQTDSMAATRIDQTYGVVPKAVYVAWNVNSTQAGGSQISKVMVEGSEDGAHTFSTMQRAGVGSAPQIMFTQATAAAQTTTSLAGSVSAGANSIIVNSSASFPSAPFAITIDSESMLVTSRVGNLWNVTRFSGAVAHSNGANVTLNGQNGGGILTIVWSNGSAVIVDQSSPDQGVADESVTSTQSFTFGGGGITDAIKSNSTVTTTNLNALAAGDNVVWVPASTTGFAVGDQFTTSESTAEQFAINAISNSSTTLTALANPGAIPPATENVTVASSNSFRTGDLIQIDSEQMTIQSINGSTLTVLRNQGGTLGAHIANTTITNLTEIRWAVTGGQAGTTPAAHAAGLTLTRVTTNIDIPQTSTFNGTVNITQADLTTIKDLDVTLNLVDPNLDQVKITLQGPVGTTINLVLNRVDNAGNTLPQGVAAGANIGDLVRGTAPNQTVNPADAVFDDSADRSITDPSATAEYVGHFRPESGSLSQFNNMLATAMNGTWTMKITDFRNSSNPIQFLTNWSLHFTGLIDTTGFGADKAVAGSATVPGSATNTYSTTGSAYGTPGVGPGVVVVQDKTLGSFSQFQGRIYIAYTGGGGSDTNVYLQYSDDNGATWSAPNRVNDDSASDNFSEGNRPQFTPSITVDQSTGTLVVSYYDARNDASLTRAANSVVASVDGGDNFSPVSYLSPLSTATDFLTNDTVGLGPIPGNQGQAGANGFGDREGIVASAGKIFAVYASNLNSGGSSIYLGKAVTADGPRVIYGDMGTVVAAFRNESFTYNTTRAADGTRQLSGFVVQFDRPVDVSTFNASDVTVKYQDPNTGAVSNVTVGTVTALDTGGFGPNNVGAGALSMRFYVSLQTPQSKVGTYSYSIGPDISDKIRTGVATYGLVSPSAPFNSPFVSTDVPKTIPDQQTITSNLSVPALPSGQVIGKVTITLNITHTYDSDLAITLISPTGTRILLSDHNGTAGQNFTGTTFDDAATTPISAGTDPYSGTFSPDSPLSALIGQDPNGTWKLEVADTVAVDSGTLNSWSITVTPAAVSISGQLGNKMDQNANSVTNEANVDAFAVPTPTNGVPFSAPYDAQTLPLIIPGPYIIDTSVPNNPATSDNLVLNTTNKSLVVTFDRDINGSTFTVADILSIQGPVGPISIGGSTINQSGGISAAATTLTVLFAGDLPSGQFFITVDGEQMLVTSVVGNVLHVQRGQNGTTAVAHSNGVAVLPVTVTQLSSRTFRIGFPTQTLSGSYNIVFSPNITDTSAQANLVDTNQNAGIDVLRGVSNAGAASVFTRSVYQTNPGLAIPSKGSISSKISIADIFQIAQSTTVPQFSSGQQTTLNGAISAGATSLVVASSTGFPAVPFTIKIDNEQILVTAKTGSGFNTWTIQRGYNGTTAATHASGKTVTLGQAATIELMLNIQHPDIQNLTVTLTAPDSTVITLFSNVPFGATHANFNNTVFDDTATNPIQLAGAPVGVGPFTAQMPLSLLNGKNANGLWTLTVSNSGTTTGTLSHWELRLPKTVTSSNLGEAVADQFSASFRIFTQATTNVQSSDQWTAVGPAAENSGANSGRIGGLAIDPSDPSGNTVFAAGASGGVWKTSNFLTNDANGPVWIPLTDLGPGYSLNVGSIAVFGRNSDPNQSVVFVATGEGDVGSSGVGFLRSLDGGKTWQVLDSTTNVDGSGNILPMASSSRDHIFVGTTSFKVVVDPTPLPNGNIVVYGALSGTNGGIWRSVDGGNNWTKIRGGNATDVVLGAASRDANGNLGVLYAAFRSEGVYITHNATTATSLALMTGGQIQTPRVADDLAGAEIPTTAPSSVPNGSKGRIVLATPVLTNSPLADTFYQGWLYAAVVTTSGTLDGVYLTKDFGLNWTKLNLPAFGYAAPDFDVAYGTNNETRTNYNPLGGPQFAQGNYDISFAIDPNNPNITYLGGSEDGAADPAGGMIRIDATTVDDPYTLSAYSNDEAAGGVQIATTGPTSIGINPPQAGPGAGYGILNPNDPTSAPQSGFLNLYREPTDPFVNPSTLHFTNVSRFNNSGTDVRWMPFNDALDGTTDQHELITFKDPVTGLTRLIFGDDQGIFTGVDDGSGNLVENVGTVNLPTGARNGNIQIAQFYYGAAQPSTLAADLAGALFYGMAQDDGFPVSASDILSTGNLNWDGPTGDGTGVATDQTGSGTAYEYQWPCCLSGEGASGSTSNFSPTDFFQVTLPGQAPISRTSGLVQVGDDPGNGVGQWPFTGGSNFAVNNFDPSAIAMSSQAGRIFLTAGVFTGGYGIQWHVVGDPSDLDGTYAPAMAFGAPPSSLGTPNDFIYAGTEGGHIYVVFTGGSPGTAWKNISTGLDGSAVQSIVTNTAFGSHEAYAVTLGGVYWMKDSSAATPTWVKLNDLNGTATTINQSSGISATATTMIVASSANLPATPFLVKIDNELIKVTNVTGTTWTLSRGYNYTTAATHANAAAVTQYNPLFNLNRPIWNNSSDPYPTLKYLSSIQADWRYAIPDNYTNLNQSGGVTSTATSLTVKSSSGFPSTTPFVIQIDSEQIQVTSVSSTTWTISRGYNGTIAAAHANNALITLFGGGTHPVLYVAGEGGVFRSIDKGVTWTSFPNVEDDGAVQDGGYMPNAHVSDLDLVLGNFDPATGFYDTSAGFNMLLATTYGRGDFAIRLDNSAISQFIVVPNSGPQVTDVSEVLTNNGTTYSGYVVTFGGAVDPSTFTTADVTVTAPNNSAVSIASVVDISGTDLHNVWQINFTSAQSATGTYTLKIGPNILDNSGNAMDQNANNINGENPGDIFTNTYAFTANQLPTISTIGDMYVIPGGAAVSANFTVGDFETPASSLLVSTSYVVNSGTATLTITLGGSGANRTIDVSAPSGQHGSATVTVKVTDGGGLSTSTTFVVNVDNVPTLPAITDPTTVQHGSTPTVLALGADDPDHENLKFTVTFTDPLYTVKTQYGLTNAAYSFNYSGNREWYLQSSTTGAYFLIMPDNKLYAWKGSVASSIAQTALVDFSAAAYSVNVYENPSLLTSNTGTPLVSVANPLYDLKTKYGLDTAAYGFNYFGGNEWILHSSNGSNSAHGGYYLLLPNNTLVAWQGNIGNGALVADFTALGYGNIYADPTSLTSAFPGSATINQSGGIGASDTTMVVKTTSLFASGNFDIIIGSEQIHVVSISGSNWTITRGVNGTTAAAHANGSAILAVGITASAPDWNTSGGAGGTLTLTPTKEFQRSVLVAVYAKDPLGDTSLTRTFTYTVSNVAPSVTVNSGNPVSTAHDTAISVPYLVADSNPDSATRSYSVDVSGYNPLYDVQSQLGLTSPAYSFNYYLLGEWSLHSNNGSNSAHGGYYILKGNKLYAWDGVSASTSVAASPVIDFTTATYGGVDVSTTPSLLTSAVLPNASLYVNTGSLYTTKVTYGLDTAAYSLNYYGHNEWSLHSSNGSNAANGGYYLLGADNKLYAWMGSYSATVAQPVVADLSADDPHSDPSKLTSATATFVSNPYYDLREKLSLGTANYSLNYYGQNEWSLASTTGKYYILMPNNKLFAWAGSISLTTAQTPVADFNLSPYGLNVYNDPTILYSNTGQAAAVTATVVGSNINLTPNAAFVGTVRVTLTVSDGAAKTSQSFLVTVTDNNSPSLPVISDTVVSHDATVPTIVNLNATDGDGETPQYAATVSGYNPLYDVKVALGLTSPAYSFNYYLLGEWSLHSNNGSNSANGGYYILKGNKLYAWDGVSASTSVAASPVIDFTTATYGGVDVSTTPSLLTSAELPSAIVYANRGPLYDTKVAYGLDTPAYSYGYYGHNEWSLHSSNGSNAANGGYFILASDNKIYAWTGSYSSSIAQPAVADLSAYDPHTDPSKLTGAQATFISDPIFDLKSRLGLNTAAYSYNYSNGSNEWYLQSSSGSYYILMPDNKLYAWAGSLASSTAQTAVADFSSALYASTLYDPSNLTPTNLNVYATPSLLTAGTGQQPAVKTSFSGGNLQITPNAAFVGTVRITVTTTDGAKSTTRSFLFTVNDNSPTINGGVQLANPAAYNSADAGTAPTGDIAINAADADAGDTLQFAATVSNNPLYLLKTQYGLIQNNSFDLLGGHNEKWFTSNNGSNSVHGGTYFLTTTNQLYAWDGVSYTTSVAQGPVADFTSSLYGNVDVYSNPSLLYNAIATDLSSIGTSFVSGKLRLTWSNTFTGQFLVTVVVGDGALEVQQTLLITVS